MAVTFAHATTCESAEVRAAIAEPMVRSARGRYAHRFAELKGAAFAGCDRSRFAGLRRATRAGDALAVLVLCDLGSTPDAFRGESMSPLMIACKHGYALCVELLIALGAQINRKHRSITALHYACTAMHIECVNVLLAHGATTETYPRYVPSALAMACGRGFVCGVRALLRAHARVDDHSMHWTVLRGEVDVLSDLIGHRGDVNTRGSTGATPLVKLCLMRQFVDWKVLQCAQLLVDARAEVDARALNGDGALTGAIRAGGASVQLVTLLLRANARPAPAHDFDGHTTSQQLAMRALGGWTPAKHQLFGAPERAHARFLLFVGAQLCTRHGYDLMHAWTDQVMSRCIVRQPLCL
jgi:ankyrin repeat protein